MLVENTLDLETWKGHANRGTGTSTYVGSKKVVAAGNEKQVVTIARVNDALAFHSVTYETPANVSLAALGLVAGDWIEIQIPVELNDWAGWDYLDGSIRGPVQICNTVTVTGGGWTRGNYIGGRRRSLICGSKLLAADWADDDEHPAR
jgi:hypothetical protein